MKDLIALLAEFSNARGVSGYEAEVAALFKDELGALVDEVAIDHMGNVIGIRRASGGPAIMLAAHMDEVGLMVKHIDEQGFLRVVSVGGIFEQTLLSQRVLVETRSGVCVPGVVGCRPPHLMEEEERKKPVKLKDMFVDIGATSAEGANGMGVEIGSPITIDRQLVPMSSSFVSGKALDNRAGMAMIVSALQKLQGKEVNATIYAVGTVQEEVGLKGARTCAYSLCPDAAIATDVSTTGDHPGITRNDRHVVLGEGPVITILDASGRGVITPRPVLRWLRGAADAASVPYQLDVGAGGQTDAAAIHLTKAGIPTGVVSVPTRYIHSPVEVLSLDDLDKAADLVAQALLQAHEYFTPGAAGAAACQT
jgi:putative aminopeptidase FrvX